MGGKLGYSADAVLGLQVDSREAGKKMSVVPVLGGSDGSGGAGDVLAWNARKAVLAKNT